ncbi:MAG: alkaline phosphatase family protein [Bdellovibrio sp.]
MAARLFFIVIFITLTSCQHIAKLNNPKDQIKHVVVIYLENHSFYNLFPDFPGAQNNLPINYQGQKNADGKLYSSLPPVTVRNNIVPDPRFPTNLPNKPFVIDKYIKPFEKVPDPIHEFHTHQLQINNGLNDLFVAYSGVGALPMGSFDMKKTFLWKMAAEYTLADQFYQSAFGGSFLNHQWLIAAQTPLYKNPPKELLIELNAHGIPTKGKPLTPDGYAVNSIQPFFPPFEPEEAKKQGHLPPLNYPTIGDRLSEKNISWAWYAGGWNDALAAEGKHVKSKGNFQHHHQPFLYFEKYGPETIGRKEHLKDEQDLMKTIRDNNLPAVAFFKPVGDENAHPGYSEVSSADMKLRQVVEALQGSSQWNETLIIITFDEHGGFWDPASPQKIDRWGVGSRIPAIFVSPLVKKHFIDHTSYETVSILSFLEEHYGLAPLTERDKNANPLSGIWMNAL